MHPFIWFWFSVATFVLLIMFFDIKCSLLRDTSTAQHKPYSFARIQLAWWTVIIFSSLIAILTLKAGMPTFDSSILVLLGISSATTAAARVIDVADQQNTNIVRNQNGESENFLLDILSDNNGVSMHRFQTVVLNIIFGVWFACSMLDHLKQFLNNVPYFANNIDHILPVLDPNNLILLGLSSGTYAALKIAENKK
ncbi:MAG TPA: hypothetical protein VMU30_12865 [Bacteroidota bacterium]|nr:hypothetical protein [Bacteroidota bacterium]